MKEPFDTASKNTAAFNKVLLALSKNYSWAIDDHRASQVVQHDHSPVKIDVLASVNGNAVTVHLSGGVNYIRQVAVDTDGVVHLTALVVERNHSVGEVANAEEFFKRYNDLPDKELTFYEIAFLNKEVAAA